MTTTITMTTTIDDDYDDEIHSHKRPGYNNGATKGQDLLEYFDDNNNADVADDDYYDDIHLSNMLNQAADVKLKRGFDRVICVVRCHKQFQSASDVQTCIDDCASEEELNSGEQVVPSSLIESGKKGLRGAVL